ncbi:3-dehydroquinate synthase [Thalassobacillus pellis]|uniref:3-dehydroquinate synthase n=1 Tax=Thalassobacillus pellis TaxID=748008 RepID=UPI0019606DF8|nr:3-dehydroquinate synthase [Thalassobacillus pellis]MBM7552467.1 3-dehydroquinate synthase [Thalassobacillus pellis]
MKQLTVQSSHHKYKVSVGPQLRQQAGELLEREYSKILIITDTSVAPLYLRDVRASFTKSEVFTGTVPAGEASKNLAEYEQLITKCLEYGLDRQSLIIALGGGVVGDLAGFVAATFMRGIDYVQLPTTILAHDSSVGGKVAVNHPQGKNMIGSFHSPKAVIYDVETLRTLPEHEIRSGYAEVIKHGCLSSPQLFYDILTKDLKGMMDPDILTGHLIKGISIKAEIVELDEKENGVRKHLNFGHTLGHAIEAELGYGKVTHGEAVAVGMLFAMYVSERKLEADLPYKELTEWLVNNGYPVHTLPKVSVTGLMKKMKQDKKAINGNVHMVLLRELGSPIVLELEEEDIQSMLSSFISEVMNR